MGLKLYTITAAIKKSIVKKKKKQHDEIILLGKSKLNNIGVLISKTLIDLVVSHDEFVLINYVIKEYDKMKEETKNLKNKIVNQRFQSIYKTTLSHYCLKCRKK